MRSNLFVTGLAIALGFMTPIGSAIGASLLLQSQVNAAGIRTLERSIKPTPDYPIDKEARSLAVRANILDIEGQYDKAIEYAFSSYLKSRISGDLIAESRALFILGQINSYHLKNHEKSLDYLKKSLRVLEKTNDVTFQIYTLCAIGKSLSELGKAEEAISILKSALEMYKNNKHIDQDNNENITFMSFDIHLMESYALYNLGSIYLKKKRVDESLNFVYEALLSSRKFNNSWVERETLSTIGDISRIKKEDEMAIVFYKQAIQATERIRAGLTDSSAEGQKAYLNTVSSTYRNLADLLLSQGRVLEAQQVLELLKVQELRDFTKNTRYGGTADRNLLNPLEKNTTNAFDDKIKLGDRLTECEKIKCSDKSQLVAQVTQANATFEQTVERLKKALKANEIQDPAQLQTDKLTKAAQNIILKNPRKTILVYPLVLEDKLWLVWGTQAGKASIVFDSVKIDVTRKTISSKALELSELLRTPSSDPKKIQQISQQLYQWLIQPIRQRLDNNGIQNIVFSLDRATRYLPMAALHDGNQYLIENFTLSTILTAETDTTDKLNANPTATPVLGLGVSQAIDDFPALPAVETELEGIRKIFPGMTRLNRDFTEAVMRENIPDHRILHIATHGTFTTNPNDSFLLLGNGKRLTIPEIKSMKNLADTHLVVLSACETAKGGMDTEGMEIAGIGHYFLDGGAKSVIASLWLVNDPATALLMRDFYTHLATGKLTKAEALRQTQLAFIKGDRTTESFTDRPPTDSPKKRERTIQRDLPENSLAHPYYWAPFILIGNNL